MTNPLNNRTPDKPRHIIVLILPKVQLLDLAGPVQVFDTAARLGASYTLSFCAADEEIQSAQQLCLARLRPLPEVSKDDIVLVPGCRDILGSFDHLIDDSCKKWLQKSYDAGAHMASVCTGAAALGEAGLLDNRKCTTHWAFIKQLQERYPAARVQDGVLYVHDGRITTSAGVSSGVDMALWLLEQDYGPELMVKTARQLVVYIRRNGHEQQASVFFLYRSHLDPIVHSVQDWLIEHCTENVTLPDLAAMARVSERTLTRAFRSATGITPHQYQQLLRLEIATQLLAETDLNMETIADTSGFGEARNLRRVWRTHFRTSLSSARNNKQNHIIETGKNYV